MGMTCRVGGWVGPPPCSPADGCGCRCIDPPEPGCSSCCVRVLALLMRLTARPPTPPQAPSPPSGRPSPTWSLCTLSLATHGCAARSPQACPSRCTPPACLPACLCCAADAAASCHTLPTLSHLPASAQSALLPPACSGPLRSLQICDASGNEFCNVTAALDGPTCPPWDPPPLPGSGGGSSTGAIVGGVVGGVVGGALLALAAVLLVRHRRRRRQRMSPFIAEVRGERQRRAPRLGLAGVSPPRQAWVRRGVHHLGCLVPRSHACVLSGMLHPPSLACCEKPRLRPRPSPCPGVNLAGAQQERSVWVCQDAAGPGGRRERPGRRG